MAKDKDTPADAPVVGGMQQWISQPVVASFMAGGVAGAVSRTVVSPLERLKILLQVQSTGNTEYKMSVGKALAKIWREEGFKGMMAGNGTNCIRIVPYSAVQFGSYNLYKGVRRTHPIRLGEAVLTCASVLRTLPRSSPPARTPSRMWSHSRHNIRRLHVPSRHC